MVVTENFYKRHVLAEQANRLSDNELLTLFTVRVNKIDAINLPAVKTALAQVTDGPRGA